MNKVIAILVAAFIVAALIDTSRHVIANDAQMTNEWRHVEKLIGENEGELIYTSHKIRGNAYMLLMMDERCGLQNFYKIRLSYSDSHSADIEPVIIKKTLENGEVAHLYLFEELEKEDYYIIIEDEFDRAYQEVVSITGTRLYGDLKFLIDKIHEGHFLDVHYPVNVLVQKADSIETLQIVYTVNLLYCKKEMIDIKSSGNYIQFKEKIGDMPVEIITAFSKNAIPSFIDFEEKLNENASDETLTCEEETLEIYFNDYYKKYTNKSCNQSIYQEFKILKQALGYQKNNANELKR